MQYALVNGARQEAKRKLRGTCPHCDGVVIPKCGQQRIPHWAHLGKLECDRWWERETEWHREWKALFPKEWQEVRHVAADSERHIADIRNDKGLVIELQHSPIPVEERLSRENFYKNMVWVVDGMRFKRDLAAFREALAKGVRVNDAPLHLDPLTRAMAIVQRWAPLHRDVFIDFGDEDFHMAGFRPSRKVLWQFVQSPETRRVLIAAVTRESFIQFCLDGSEWQYFGLKQEPGPRYLPNRRGRALRLGRGRYISY